MPAGAGCASWLSLSAGRLLLHVQTAGAATRCGSTRSCRAETQRRDLENEFGSSVALSADGKPRSWAPPRRRRAGRTDTRARRSCSYARARNGNSRAQSSRVPAKNRYTSETPSRSRRTATPRSSGPTKGGGFWGDERLRRGAVVRLHHRVRPGVSRANPCSSGERDAGGGVRLERRTVGGRQQGPHRRPRDRKRDAARADTSGSSRTVQREKWNQQGSTLTGATG